MYIAVQGIVPLVDDVCTLDSVTLGLDPVLGLKVLGAFELRGGLVFL